ncbi:MAG: bacterioferritin [Neisseriaceae bacterium]
MEILQQVRVGLNEALGVELIVINQSFLHARMLKHWSYEKLANIVYKRSIQIMRTSDELIQRLFILEGLPNLQKLGKLLIGQTVPEILNCDLELEFQLQRSLTDGINNCELDGDYVSQALLINHLKDSETHANLLEEQLGVLEVIGLEDYLESLVS